MTLSGPPVSAHRTTWNLPRGPLAAGQAHSAQNAISAAPQASGDRVWQSLEDSPTSRSFPLGHVDAYPPGPHSWGRHTATLDHEGHLALVGGRSQALLSARSLPSTWKGSGLTRRQRNKTEVLWLLGHGAKGRRSGTVCTLTRGRLDVEYQLSRLKPLRFLESFVHRWPHPS